MSRVQIPSPAPIRPSPLRQADILFKVSKKTKSKGSHVPFPVMLNVQVARYPSGKGEVCKTFMRRFDPDPRLHPLPDFFLRTSPIHDDLRHSHVVSFRQRHMKRRATSSRHRHSLTSGCSAGLTKSTSTNESRPSLQACDARSRPCAPQSRGDSFCSSHTHAATSLRWSTWAAIPTRA